MGEGKPHSPHAQPHSGTHSEAHANVSQETILDPAQWNTGTPKNPGDAITQGIYPDASDENAHAGDTTSVAQRAAGQREESAHVGGEHNPATYGSMKGGDRPASGATSSPEKAVDGDEAFK